MNIHPVFLNHSLYTKRKDATFSWKRVTKEKKVHQGNGAPSQIQVTLESLGVNWHTVHAGGRQWQREVL